MNSHTGALSRSHRYRSSSRAKSPITIMQYRSFSLLARGPVLLTCMQDGSLSLLRSDWSKISYFFQSLFLQALIRRLFTCSVAVEVQGYLTLRCSLKLTPRIHRIRASFCPLLSLEKGEYIGLIFKSFLLWAASLVLLCGFQNHWHKKIKIILELHWVMRLLVLLDFDYMSILISLWCWFMNYFGW